MDKNRPRSLQAMALLAHQLTNHGVLAPKWKVPARDRTSPG